MKTKYYILANGEGTRWHNYKGVPAIWQKVLEGKLLGACRPVKCLNTGVVYRSISEAKRELNLPKSTHIQEVCAGKLKQTKGLMWSYV